jgi:hypothetical protein
MATSNRPSQNDHGRYAAGLFAATVVLTVGAAACLMMVVLFAKDAWPPTIVFAFGILALIVTARMLSVRPSRRSQEAALFAAEREGLDRYVAICRRRRRSERAGNAALGAQQPPTVDDIRDIRANSNAWTPSDRRAESYRRTLEPPADP